MGWINNPIQYRNILASFFLGYFLPMYNYHIIISFVQIHTSFSVLILYYHHHFCLDTYFVFMYKYNIIINYVSIHTSFSVLILYYHHHFFLDTYFLLMYKYYIIITFVWIHTSISCINIIKKMKKCIDKHASIVTPEAWTLAL